LVLSIKVLIKTTPKYRVNFDTDMFANEHKKKKPAYAGFFDMETKF